MKNVLLFFGKSVKTWDLLFLEVRVINKNRKYICGKNHLTLSCKIRKGSTMWKKIFIFYEYKNT